MDQNFTSVPTMTKVTMKQDAMR